MTQPQSDPPKVWIDEPVLPDVIVQGQRYRPTGTVTAVETPPVRGALGRREVLSVLWDILGVIAIIGGSIGLGIMLYRISPDLMWSVLFAAVTVVGVLVATRRT